MTFKLISLDMRMATPEDQHLDTYDHTKLSNINTCPTWGILRYSQHKRMPGTSRAIALEAGSAAHEGFAATRWYQYWKFQCSNATQEANAMLHGHRLFGADRFKKMFDCISKTAADRTNSINFTLEALETSDFYDDIGDRKRTISNIAEALIAYVDAYDMQRYPIWVRDKDDPRTDIGIEITFDIVVDIVYTDEETYKSSQEWEYPLKKKLKARFTGKLDGLHWNKKNLMIQEEKTGARLDDAWLAQWVTSHQITGYCLASTTFTGLDCSQALVGGMRIPIGKYPSEGIRRETVNRNPMLYEKWANWFLMLLV